MGHVKTSGVYSYDYLLFVQDCASRKVYECEKEEASDIPPTGFTRMTLHVIWLADFTDHEIIHRAFS